MGNEINLTKRLIGKEDINFDFYGEDEKSSYLLPDGSEQSVRKINASHVPLRKKTREAVNAENVDDALNNLSKKLSGSTSLNVLEKNTTVIFSTEDTVSIMQNKINQQPKNLNGFVLTFNFPEAYDQSFYSSLDWIGFFNGSLIIQGGSGNNKIMIYDRQSGMDAIFRFIQCQCQITCRFFHFIHVYNNAAIITKSSPGMSVEQCVFQGKEGNAQSVSIDLKSGGVIELNQCDFINDKKPFPQQNFENVSADIAKMGNTKLSTSGGTMTGNLVMAAGGIKRADPNNALWIYGATGSTDGAYIEIGGKDYQGTEKGGNVYLNAKNSSSHSVLKLSPDGSMTLNNRYIARSVNGVNADTSGNITITADTVKALPLSGGTMTGALKFSGGACFVGTATDSENLVIVGGNAWGKGATITLSGNSKSSNAGDMYFYTWQDNGNANILCLGHNGNFHLNSKHIVRSVDGALADAAGNVSLNALPTTGGTMTGNLTFGTAAAIGRNVNNAQLTVYGGTNYTSGACIVLWGQDYDNGTDAPGMFKLRASNAAGTYCELIGTPAGGMSWNGKDITLGYPNYAAGVTATASTYTASLDGWVCVRKKQDGLYCIVKVNGYLCGSGGGSDDDITTIMLPVKAGDVVTIFYGNDDNLEIGTTTATVTFYPNR